MPLPVTVDPSLCVDALSCGACLQACSRGVLMTRPVVRRGQRAWRVLVVLSRRCDRCGLCIAACPRGAVTITPGLRP